MFLEPQAHFINIYITSFSKIDQNLMKRSLEKKLRFFFYLMEKEDYYGPYFHIAIVNLPIDIRKLTLLKSPHVHKKAKQHFIQKKYTTLIKIQIAPRFLCFDFLLFKSKLNTLLDYFTSNCLNSVKLVIKWEKHEDDQIKSYFFS